MHADIEEFWAYYMGEVFASEGGGPDRIFRGVTDSCHHLIPSIGRKTEKHTSGDIATLENMLLGEFKRLATAELEALPTTDFEWLFLAQHYGLPTRLLDWTSNPLVALFFAAEREDEKDGAVFYLSRAVTDQYELFDYKTANYTREHQQTPVSLFALQQNQGDVIFVRPKYKDRRYNNQKSIFSCHKEPFKNFSPDDLKSIRFKSHLKPKIRDRLKKMGMSASHLYPGLGGIASEVKTRHFDPVTNGRLQIAPTIRLEIKL